MLSFRILGPLEVRDEQAAIALGGPRQRALLVALLLRAGRVVPIEQLVDELYGEDPPKTATTSVQNAIVALRKALGPGVLVTRPPGYALQIEREQLDAHHFERLLADARRASTEERRALLVRALELWRGPALAEFAFEDWAQTEARRLEELRLVALEERIATDIELGHPADVVSELDSLVVEHPLRERLWYLLMSARHEAGRSAEALQAYTDARAHLDELGIEPGEALRRLQGGILRGEATGSRRSNGHGADRDADSEVVKALLSGRVVPVLGLDGGADLAAQLALAFGYPTDRPPDLARVSQYVATMKRLRAAVRRAAPSLRGGGGAAARASLPGRPAVGPASGGRRTSSSSRPATTLRSSGRSRRRERSSTSSPMSPRASTGASSGTGHHARSRVRSTSPTPTRPSSRSSAVPSSSSCTEPSTRSRIANGRAS